LAAKKFRHQSGASARRRGSDPRLVGKHFPKYRASLLIALLWSPAWVSRGQEALRSALSADAAIESQSATNAAPAPDVMHIGPVNLNLGTYAGVTLEDNVNISQNKPQGDASIHAGLDFGVLWPASDSSRLQFDSQIGYVTYLAHTRTDSIEIAPNSALTWNISFADGSLAFYDQFEYSQEVITVPSVRGLDSLPRLINTVGVRAQWLPGKWVLEAGISHSDFQSTDATFNYLDSGSEYFFARAARSFAEKTQAGLEFSAGQTDYRLPIQQNNQSYSLGPYLNWNITEFLTASLRGGPTIYTFESIGPARPGKTLTAYYFNFDLSHHLTEFVFHELSAKREVNLGLNRGNDYNEQLSVDYSVHWAATQNADLSLSLAYEKGTQPLTINFLPQTENFERVGVSLGGIYRFTENLGGSLNFSHWIRTSNLDGNNYTDNIVSLQMNYRF
jgi:hypothetical protein